MINNIRAFLPSPHIFKPHFKLTANPKPLAVTWTPAASPPDNNNNKLLSSRRPLVPLPSSFSALFLRAAARNLLTR
jgi:hypothetical protein